MVKKLILSLLLLISLTGHAHVNNLCKERILRYQHNNSSDFYFPHARVSHLLDLIANSQNKFKLIGDLYLHYISIENVDNKLSLILESCLLDLLKITENKKIVNYLKIRRNFNSCFNDDKLSDPVCRTISSYITNKKFVRINRPAFSSLYKLYKKEQCLFSFSEITKLDFDNIIKIDKHFDMTPELAQKLLEAYEKIMAVSYEGHDIYTRCNIQVVKDFINLLDNINIKNYLTNNLISYEYAPTPELFNHIKSKIRIIYELLSGEHMAQSQSEIWEKWLTITEEIQGHMKDEIMQLKNTSNNLDIIEDAAYQIIALFESQRKEAR